MSQTVEPVPARVRTSVVRQRWGVPRCGYFSNAGMLWIAGRVQWLSYVLVWFAAIYFFVCVPKARQASLRYLDRILGRRGPMTRAWQTYRHFVEFGYLLVDRALMLSRAEHGFEIQCRGLLNLTTASIPKDGQPRGVLLLTAHFGNAEIAAPYLKFMGLSGAIHMVMYRDALHGTERFHATNRPMLDGVHVISTTDPLAAGAAIIGALRKGETVAMRADRTLSGRGIPVTFFGERVVLPAGPFLAAALTGVPVIDVHTIRTAARRYECRISPARQYGETEPGTRDERVGRAAQDFATHLEALLRAYPYQWSNFYDFWHEQASEQNP